MSVLTGVDYSTLLHEIKPDLEIAPIRMAGAWLDERRMTRLYALDNTPMSYSGRVAIPIIPTSDSIIYRLLEGVNSQTFLQELVRMGLSPKVPIPEFNAVFVNWYRPPSETPEKVDGLGYHADDEKDLLSDIILSITLCEENGERLFRFRAKRKSDGSKKTSGFDWEAEIPDGALLIMLSGCQRDYKHTVVMRSTKLNRSRITGGRINLTFRAIRK
jgi:hypothetical protein